MATGILIPARYGSSRLPGKPLIEIAGKPAIQHVYDACSATGFQTWVVTDDQRIADAVGAENALIVANDCASGTERCALALNQVPATIDTICIVAGDQLTVTTENVETLINAAGIGQLWTGVSPQKDHAVTTCEVRRGLVTEFNRGQNLSFAALGMYVYPRNMLFDYYTEWPTWATERLLGAELVRAYMNHVSIYAAKIDCPGIDLNTYEDITLIESWYASAVSLTLA